MTNRKRQYKAALRAYRERKRGVGGKRRPGTFGMAIDDLAPTPTVDPLGGTRRAMLKSESDVVCQARAEAKRALRAAYPANPLSLLSDFEPRPAKRLWIRNRVARVGKE